MNRRAIQRFTGRTLPWVALMVLLLTSLYLMSAATHDAARFGRYYAWLLGLNGLALLILFAVIVQQVLRLYAHLKRGAPGARLTRRFVLVFMALVAPPVIVVYLFSVELLHRGIDSWFDVRVEQGLEDALRLGQIHLDSTKRDLLSSARRAGTGLRGVSADRAPQRLSEWLREIDASQLTLFSAAGRIIATSSNDPRSLVPDYPEPVALSIARQRDFYAVLEPAGEDSLRMRILINLGASGPFEESRIMQAIFDVPGTVGRLADRIGEQHARYETLVYLRQPLKMSFTITLSLVLLLSLLMAMIAAFRAARRLVAPIRDLSLATEEIAEGRYGRQLPSATEDELGFLVRSFNDMTREIDRSTRRAEQSRLDLERQRGYLEAILARLSSGVLTVDTEGRLRTSNRAADDILGLNLEQYVGRSLEGLEREHPQIAPLARVLLDSARNGREDWREEIMLFGGEGRQVLMCRGTLLAPEGGGSGGQVVVFDDLTALIQAQRDAAWAEMARRLAHEVKNPLTPIQLSAERLRRRYLGRMEPEDADLMDRATNTIVHQVESLKKLINAFGDYARTPRLQFERLSINQLVREVADLYRGDDSNLAIDLELDDDAPLIEADPDRVRQLLHNLIKNAQEAVGPESDCRLAVGTRTTERGGHRHLTLSIQDNGPGFPDDLMDRLFEPYTTTKLKGSGLGLAIVKKIVEEHGGIIRADNPPDGGARMEVWLPVRNRQRAGLERRRTGSNDSP